MATQRVGKGVLWSDRFWWVRQDTKQLLLLPPANSVESFFSRFDMIFCSVHSNDDMAIRKTINDKVDRLGRMFVFRMTRIFHLFPLQSLNTMICDGGSIGHCLYQMIRNPLPTLSLTTQQINPCQMSDESGCALLRGTVKSRT